MVAFPGYQDPPVRYDEQTPDHSTMPATTAIHFTSPRDMIRSLTFVTARQVTVGQKIFIVYNVILIIKTTEFMSC